MTSDDENGKLPETPSKRSDESIPAQSNEPTAPSDLLDTVPPEILETFAELLKEAGDDPVKIRRFMKLSWSIYRGPYPPAQVFKEYEDAFPGAAQWLFDRTTERINHRQHLENKQVDGSEARMNRSQFFSVVIALASIIGAMIVAIYTKSWIVPSVMMVVGVGGPTAGQILARSLFNLSNERKENGET